MHKALMAFKHPSKNMELGEPTGSKALNKTTNIKWDSTPQELHATHKQLTKELRRKQAHPNQT
jgi:hypothetical protein